jgi:hypothetical protein
MRRLRRVAVGGRGLLLAVLGPIALGLALGGCATSSTEPSPLSLPFDRTAIEDDGLPAQVAPPAGLRQTPDDPSEPFSPNYGPQPPRSLSQAEADAVMAQAITAHEMRRP